MYLVSGVRNADGWNSRPHAVRTFPISFPLTQASTAIETKNPTAPPKAASNAAHILCKNPTVSSSAVSSAKTESIGKIYIEVKHRPRYNIEKVLK